MFAPKKILVPTDFSVYADNALKYALDVAKDYKAKIFLFHVIDDRFQECTLDYCLDEEVIHQIFKESLVNAQNKLREQARKIAEDNSDIEIESDAKRGITSEEILKAQEEKEIDLIVIASHGKTGILKNLLGGVASRVMKRAKCPVLLVRS